MPRTSHRAQSTHASPFRKLADLALRAEAEGKKIYYLNIGQPDIKTPPQALQKIRDNHTEIIKYGPARGLSSYRTKLQGYYQKLGIQLNYDDITISSGASEGIYFLMLSCLEKEEEVIVPEPLYANYIGFSNMADVHLRPITSTIETGFALPEVDAFEAAITEKTRGIFICNPNNPTGAVYSRAALEQIGELAKRYDLFLFVDEVYREFCYDGAEFVSALNLKGLEDHVVVIDSVSKRFSACGARVGAIISRNKDVQAMITRFAQLRLSAPIYGQLLAEYALDDHEQYLAEVKQEYKNRRDYLVSRLQQIPGVQCYTPQGAFYTFARLPIEDAEHFCQWLLTDFEYQGETLMLSPGPGFYVTKGLGKDEVRFAYVLNTGDLARAINCLEAALEVYPSLVTHSKLTN